MKGRTVERIKRDEMIERLIKRVAGDLITLFICTFQKTEKER